MLYKIVTTLTLSCVLLSAQNITVKPIDKISNNLVDIQKSIIENGQMYENSSVKKQIQKEKYFASVFLKKYGIDDNTSKALSLSLNDTLTKLYTLKLKEKYAPNSKVIKSFYLENRAAFTADTIVNVSTITLKTVKKADEVYSKIVKNKTEFNKLAKANSLDTNIDYVNVSISKFAPKLRKWIRDAKVGDISQPIKIGNFYFIDRVNKKVEKAPTFENLKPKLKKLLVDIYVNRLLANQYRENAK